MIKPTGYQMLDDVLARAYNQASSGKGAERHADNKPFHEQPMQRLCELYGVGFALGQAAKKAQEATRLPRDRAVAELLGAIVYLAGAVICIERQQATEPIAVNDNELKCTAYGYVGKPACPTCSRDGLCLAATVGRDKEDG